MGINFTPKQREVISAPTNNILVSAAAGSGKTAVLVQRILTMITRAENPLNIDDILVVTFTNNAAKQMKERIQKAVDRELNEHPNNAWLIRQSGRVPMANIMTIDAYCQSIVKRYFHKLDIDPNFRIMDDTEKKLLWDETVNDVLEARLASGDASYYHLVRCYGGKRGDQQLEAYIAELHRFSDSDPWPEEWLHRALAALDASPEEFEEQRYVTELLDMVRTELEDCLQLAKRVREATTGPDGAVLYCEAIDDDIAFFRLAMRCENFTSMQEVIAQHTKFATLSGKKQPSASEEKKEYVKTYRKKYKDIFENKIRAKYFTRTKEEILSSLAVCREPMHELIDVTIACVREFHKRQREANAFGFSEIEHMALSVLLERDDSGALVPSDAARQCRGQYREIMIDEYQDSNSIQDLLLRSVSTESEQKPNVFTVGDVKQSIYKFRMAKPELFLQNYMDYGKDTTKGVRIDLQQNFRSQPDILQGINEIFKKLMQKNVGGIDYTDEVALYPGREKVDSVHVRNRYLLCVSEKASARSDSEAEHTEPHHTDEEIVISNLVSEIRKMTAPNSGYQIQDGERVRPVEYGDIVVLARSKSGVIFPLIDALQDAGIPAYATSVTGYFQSREVQNVLSFLRILDNPFQDIPFATVLRSPIGGFSENDLAMLRIVGERLALEKKQPYAMEVLTYLEAMNPCTEELAPLKCKAEHFLTRYRTFFEKKSILSVPELLRDIYQNTGYLAYVSVMPQGQFREKNLRMLEQKARGFMASNFTALGDFVTYLENMIKYDVKIEDKAGDEAANAVRIMTIHASKGLEFPVVFLVDTEHGFNKQDQRSSLVMHEELGIGPQVIDCERRTKQDTLLKQIISRKKELDLLGEELRVLYVALTRAKEYLIVVGCSDETKITTAIADACSGAENRLSYLKLSYANNYQDWLMPAVFAELEDATVVSERLTNRMDSSLLVTSGAWEVQFSPYAEVSAAAPLQQEKPEERSETDVTAILDAYHTFSYPYAMEQIPPVKVSVSELKAVAMEENAVAWDSPSMIIDKEEPKEPVPAFLAEREALVRGSDRGTLYHRVLELHDYRMELTENACMAELREMVVCKKLREQDLSVLSIGKLMNYYRSPIGERMRRAALAGCLYREQPFVMEIPAKRVSEQYADDAKILVQGIIDAFFEEDGQLILLDYKTDATAKVADPEELLRGRYAKQLELYAEAITRATGQNVKERLIYSFGLQKELEL